MRFGWLKTIQICFIACPLSNIVSVVVWLWEGGTLWRAKWTRRGQKEPHPSITRVDKGGLHNTKLDVPSTNFFFFSSTAHGSAQPASRPAGECVSVPARFAPFLLHTSKVNFQSKVAAVVDASALQTWTQSRRQEGERHRETTAARRERERSGPPFPLSDARWGEKLRRCSKTHLHISQ